MSVNPGARENEVSPLPRQMALGIVNVIQAWQMTEIYDMSGKHLPVTASVVVRWRSTAEPTPLCSMFFRKVVEGKEDAIWKVKSDSGICPQENILPSILCFIFFELR